ncbi:MAG: CsiV family protein [Pseudomonadota bacterium]|nr:CsiV family protein [Pseudomonadota bacterium]
MKLSKYFLIVICCILTIPAYLENNKIDEYLIEVVIFEHLNFLTNESLSSQNLDLEDFEIISLAERKKSQINQSAINKSFKENVNNLIIPNIELSTIKKSQDPSIKSKNDFNHRHNWYARTLELNELDNIYIRINRRKEYKVLHKVSWIQPALNYEETPYIHERFDNNGLLFKLYKSRYLHIDLLTYINGDIFVNSQKDKINDIKINALKNTIPDDVEIQKITIDTQELYKNQQLKIQNKPINKLLKDEIKKRGEIDFLLNENRRIFKNEVHYFDHPRIGVIISVYDSPL